MFAEKTIAVVVPAYNEELLIAKVIGSMPDFVDHIVIVDDCSSDQTIVEVEALMVAEPRLVLLEQALVRQLPPVISGRVIIR